MFTTFMNSIFHEKLHEFVIIYIDDIVVYSKIIEEQVEHLKYVLSKLHENNFFANMAKKEFAQDDMDFLSTFYQRKGWSLTLRSCKP